MTVFLGHTRFSIDAYRSSQFNATRKKSLFSSYQEYLDWLYDDDRLQRRADILLTWTVPQLQRAAQGHQVKHVISYSPTLPTKYQQVLKQAAETYSVMALHEVEDVVDPYAPPEPVMLELLQQLGAHPGEIFGAYRLDDDDVLAVDYFEQLSGYVTNSHVGYRISLGLGYSGLWRHSGLYYCTETHYPKISMGLASVCRFEEDGTVMTPGRYFRGPNSDHHTSSDRTAPVILDSRRPAYFRIMHPTQSGVLHNTKQLNRHWYLDALRRVPSSPPADLELARAQFPVMADELHLEHGAPHEITELLRKASTIGADGTSFTTKLTGAFVVEVEFASSSRAAHHDLEIRWELNRPEDIDSAAPETSTAITNITSRSSGHYSSVPTKGGYGRWRHTVVEIPADVTVTGGRIMSRSDAKTKVKSLRITSIN